MYRETHIAQETCIIINSLILYVISFPLTTIIHETAHAVAGLLSNSDPVLYHNYVEHLSINNLSIQKQVIISLAGPILSLIQGLIAGIVFYKSKKKRLIELFVLWFSVLGLFNFFGYLMTGPLFQAGDIGKILKLLGVSFWVQIITALFGAAILLFIAYKITNPFLEFSYKNEWVNSKQSKKNFSLRILILPWIIGSGIITLLYLPMAAVVSIIYPFTSGMVFIFPWQNAARIGNVELSKNREIGKISFSSLIILVLLILLFRIILLRGIKF